MSLSGHSKPVREKEKKSFPLLSFLVWSVSNLGPLFESFVLLLGKFSIFHASRFTLAGEQNPRQVSALIDSRET